jgi:hypothetical protein
MRSGACRLAYARSLVSDNFTYVNGQDALSGALRSGFDSVAFTCNRAAITG